MSQPHARTLRQMEGDLEIMSAYMDRMIRDLRDLNKQLSELSRTTDHLSTTVRELLAELKGTR